MGSLRYCQDASSNVREEAFPAQRSWAVAYILGSDSRENTDAQHPDLWSLHLCVEVGWGTNICDSCCTRENLLVQACAGPVAHRAVPA